MRHEGTWIQRHEEKSAPARRGEKEREIGGERERGRAS